VGEERIGLAERGTSRYHPVFDSIVLLTTWTCFPYRHVALLDAGCGTLMRCGVPLEGLIALCEF
jgi:hypothetical protein